MKRVFDLFLASVLAFILVVPFCVVSVLVKLTSPGPIFYWSDRIGKNNRIFRMPKFRSMWIGTPVVATDLLSDPVAHLTPIGAILRKFSVDELPQIWSVLRGDMSFVGPRPALYNQYELIELRTKHGIHQLTPGVTGWAQINGRDELSTPEKVAFDLEYLQRKSLLFDLLIMWRTALAALKGVGVSH